MKKYYDIIGLKEGCSKEEVEKRYKQLSKEFGEYSLGNDLEDFFKKEYDKAQEAYKIIMLSIQKEDQNNKKTEKHSNALEEIRKLREEVQSKNLEIGDLKEIKKENIVKELPNATGTLVLGILAAVFMWCYGIPGIILGIIALSISSKDKNLLEENPDGYSNSGNHKAGRICAKIGIYVPLCLFIIFLLIYQNQ
tara:strand:+ start:31 stop:612 length:582 start_codon:yes stop_codon:yes gene_type:complete